LLKAADSHSSLFAYLIIKREDDMEKVWLSVYEAAEYVGLARQTLVNRRSQGLRPRANKAANRLRYHITELDDWIRSNGFEPPRRGRPSKPK